MLTNPVFADKVPAAGRLASNQEVAGSIPVTHPRTLGVPGVSCGRSSVGRALVSKTSGRGFDPLRPCHEESLFGSPLQREAGPTRVGRPRLGRHSQREPILREVVSRSGLRPQPALPGASRSGKLRLYCSTLCAEPQIASGLPTLAPSLAHHVSMTSIDPAAWAEADAVEPVASNAYHRSRDLIRGARRDGLCPEREADRLDGAVRRLERALGGARRLRQVDREEFEATMQQARAVGAVVRLLTPRRAGEVRSGAQRLLAAVGSGEARGRELEDAVLLACVATPTNGAYWGLVRGMRGLVAEGGAPSGFAEVVRVLAPDEVFGDEQAYPSAPRGGSRTTRVRGVTLGGLPGLGKGS